MRTLLLALTFLSLPMSSASAMPVSQFVTKANALEKKGAMALFASDFRLLKKEGNSATSTAIREERAAVKAGGKPTMCFPKDNNISLGTGEVLGHMRAVAARQGSMSVKDAMTGLLRKKYPCRA